jgi:hypothetical protein
MEIGMELKVTLDVAHIGQRQWERFLWQVKGGHGGGLPIEGSVHNLRYIDGELDAGPVELVGEGRGAGAILDEFCHSLDSTCGEVTIQLEAMPFERFNQVLEILRTTPFPELVSVSCHQMALEEGELVARGVFVVLKDGGIDECLKFVQPMFF